MSHSLIKMWPAVLSRFLRDCSVDFGSVSVKLFIRHVLSPRNLHDMLATSVGTNSQQNRYFHGNHHTENEDQDDQISTSSRCWRTDTGLTRQELGVAMDDRSTWRRVIADSGPPDRWWWWWGRLSNSGWPSYSLQTVAFLFPSSNSGLLLPFSKQSPSYPHLQTVTFFFPFSNSDLLISFFKQKHAQRLRFLRMQFCLLCQASLTIFDRFTAKDHRNNNSVSCTCFVGRIFTRSHNFILHV